MKDENSQSRKPATRSSFTRKLNFTSRVRTRVRGIADRAFGADLAWSLSFVVVVMVLLGSQRCGTPRERFEIGDLASVDLRARYDFEVENETLTHQRREEARSEIPEVYVHDADRELRLVGRLRQVFEHGRRVLADGGERPADAMVPDRLDSSVAATLGRKRFSRPIEDTLATSLSRVMRGLIVGNKALLEREPAIVLVHVPGFREEQIEDYGRILDIDAARDRVRELVRSSLDLAVPDERDLAELTAFFVDANVAFDPEGTRTRRIAAAESVPPVLVRVPRGTVLAREGQRLDAEAIAVLDAERGASAGKMGALEFLGLLLVVSMLAFFVFRYCHYHQRRFTKIRHLHALFVLIMLSTLVLAAGMMWVVRHVVEDMRPPFGVVESYVYLIPVGAGAVLVTLLANGRISMVYAAFTGLLFGALSGWDFYFTAWAMLVQFTGVYAISTYGARAALLRAGLVVGVAGAFSCLALETLRGSLEPLPVSLYAPMLAFVGGAVGAGLVISFTLPLLEGLFNVLTEIRLLELSNLDNPLLSQLAVKAPGSYNHSLVVGTLAEEAAKAIHANSLFCRVAAFYHDIGKIVKPEYFVENQGGDNPHDRLSPTMSSLVIASHVKDGIRMAREAGVPEQIVDIIPQHHGTRLMTYFYEKARSSTDPSMGSVKKEDFRYPGPKPQSREAAIFMLADAVEAAARTVEDPTPNRLQDMIRKVSNAIVIDGQLDECEMTFADLDRIHAAFLRALISMYHHRVDYPGFDFRKDGAVALTESPGDVGSTAMDA